MTLSEKLTYCTTKIVAEYPDGSIGTGTGFFVNFNINHENSTCQPVLITNKHVVKGADKISFNVCISDDDNNPIDTKKVQMVMNPIVSFGHPDENVDLCVIPIASLLEQAQDKKIKLFRIPLTTDIIISSEEIQDCSAMEELTMIGYPNGLEDEYNNKPIIRRGITSTHMRLDYNGKKEFLIDMACFPGSSGSPIFFCNENSYSSKGVVTIGSRIRLVGILYAGPQHTGTGAIVFENIPTMPRTVFNIPNNLGLVIKAERIKEMENIFKELNNGEKE